MNLNDNMAEIPGARVGRRAQAKAYARNLLVNQGMITYYEPYIFPDDNLKSGKVISRKQETGISGVDLKVYPNPASEYIIVEYQVNEQINKASLSIIDVLGRVQHSITLNVHKGCEVVPLFNISPGIYTIALNTNGSLVKEAKVIVSQ